LLQHARHHKSGKDLMADDGVMLLVLARLSARAVVDVREFIARFVTLILMGNTGAHLKNWACSTLTHAVRISRLSTTPYASRRSSRATCHRYGVDRAIDAILRAFDWNDLDAMLKGARRLRVSNHLRMAKALVLEDQST